MQALASAVSDPSSSSYRKFLTPAQFRQEFAPSQAQVGAVQTWLKSQGFSVEYTPQNNHYVSAEGTVAQAEAAFGTTFGEYSVGGLTVRSPESDVTIPDSLSGMVSGVAGLDDSAQFVVTDHTPGATNAPPPAAFVNAPPCSAYWGQAQATGFTNPYGTGTLPYAPCGYTPAQIKGAYGLSQTSYDGSGQTVAIIDAYASPTIAADANEWSVNRGLPQFKANQFTQVVAPGTYHNPESGKKQDPQGWYGEETLDVEAVHGMAPGANIVYVGAPTRGERERRHSRTYAWRGFAATSAALRSSSALPGLLRQPSARVCDAGSGKMSSSPFSTASKMARATDSGDAFGASRSRDMSVSTGPAMTA